MYKIECIKCGKLLYHFANPTILSQLGESDLSHVCKPAYHATSSVRAAAMQAAANIAAQDYNAAREQYKEIQRQFERQFK